MSSFPVGTQKLLSYGDATMSWSQDKIWQLLLPLSALSSHILSRGNCIEDRKDKWSREPPVYQVQEVLFTQDTMPVNPWNCVTPYGPEFPTDLASYNVSQNHIAYPLLLQKHPSTLVRICRTPPMVGMAPVFQINQHMMKERLFISNHSTFNSGFISNENLIREIRSP